MDASLVEFFLLQLDSIFTFEEEQKAALKTFSQWTMLFHFISIWL